MSIAALHLSSGFYPEGLSSILNGSTIAKTLLKAIGFQQCFLIEYSIPLHRTAINFAAPLDDKTAQRSNPPAVLSFLEPALPR